MARGVSDACGADHHLGETLRSRIGDHTDAVVGVLPDLAVTLGDAGAGDLGPEAFGEIRTVNALSVLLSALGSASRPALVLLDDCQWADESTVRLLAQWQDTGVLGDAGELDRVVINLVSNAVKFTPDGGHISISATRCDDKVALRVSDSGMGIPSDELGQIFERFFRSTSARKLAVQGTGLGLAITKKIIEEHGGTISVASRPGEGTEFTVLLPGGPATSLNENQKSNESCPSSDSGVMVGRLS